MPLTDTQKPLFEAVRNNPELRSLYKSLHYVGDDTAKAEIEDTLADLLDPETLKTIRAVFQIYTDEDLSMELNEKGFFGKEEDCSDDDSVD